MGDFNWVLHTVLLHCRKVTCCVLPSRRRSPSRRDASEKEGGGQRTIDHGEIRPREDKPKDGHRWSAERGQVLALQPPDAAVPTNVLKPCTPLCSKHTCPAAVLSQCDSQLRSVPAENFPFCTIDPSEARCPVPDERYAHLCSVWDPPSKYPVRHLPRARFSMPALAVAATTRNLRCRRNHHQHWQHQASPYHRILYYRIQAYLQCTDIAGLVRGASEGAGTFRVRSLSRAARVPPYPVP